MTEREALVKRLQDLLSGVPEHVAGSNWVVNAIAAMNEASAVLSTPPAGKQDRAITVDCFRAGDGRVFANVTLRGNQLAHLRAGESFTVVPPDTRQQALEEAAKVAISGPDAVTSEIQWPEDFLIGHSKAGIASYAYRKGEREMAEHIHNQIRAIAKGESHDKPKGEPK